MPRRRTTPRTPAERSASLAAQSHAVRRKYKTNLRLRKKFSIEGEESLVKDMIAILRVAGYTNSQIGQIVGVSRGQVREFLLEDDLQKLILILRERIPQAAVELGRAYLIEAVQAIVNIMRTSDDDAMVL